MSWRCSSAVKMELYECVSPIFAGEARYPGALLDHWMHLRVMSHEAMVSVSFFFKFIISTRSFLAIRYRAGTHMDGLRAN